jgi:hypothetical protein
MADKHYENHSKLMRMHKGRAVNFMFDGERLYGHVSGFNKMKDGTHKVRIDHGIDAYSIPLGDISVGDES